MKKALRSVYDFLRKTEVKIMLIEERCIYRMREQPKCSLLASTASTGTFPSCTWRRRITCRINGTYRGIPWRTV